MGNSDNKKKDKTLYSTNSEQFVNNCFITNNDALIPCKVNTEKIGYGHPMVDTVNNL